MQYGASGNRLRSEKCFITDAKLLELYATVLN